MRRRAASIVGMGMKESRVTKRCFENSASFGMTNNVKKSRELYDVLQYSTGQSYSSHNVNLYKLLLTSEAM